MNKTLFAIALLVAWVVAHSLAQTPSGFPQGDIKGPIVWKSTIYPGTEREYWVYVPKQYDPSKPACTMIVQDGLSRATGWKLPRVLDSLIALKEIPVIIGIFIDHGKVPASGTDNWPRFNRSFEYDALGDRYARFLVEEILPEIGKSYNLSKDPNDRSIAGASSGAICAFNAAWERPNEFRRVLSTIGTYVGLRGGDEFPTLVRKTEPKPLRVFLEDGSSDLNIYGGDWWTANQAMLSALTWAGYEVNHAWGTEGHNSKGAAKILPEALKWLWKDYPHPVKTHASPVQRFNPLLENEPWREIGTNEIKAMRIATNKTGDVFVSNMNDIHRLTSDGKLVPFVKSYSLAIAFGADGRLYAINSNQKIVSFNDKGQSQDVVSIHDIWPNNMAVSSKGIYFESGFSRRIGFYSFTNKKISYLTDSTLWTIMIRSEPNSLRPGFPDGAYALSSDQTFMNIGGRPLGYSMKINGDGMLEAGQQYIHFQIPYGESDADPGGMTVDTENRLYTATNMGIQITDQLGRTNFIILSPSPGGMSDVKFGGVDLSTLYAISGGKLYSRKLSTKGVLPFLPPVKPPKPGL